MAHFSKATTAPPSPCLQGVTPPDSERREVSLRSTDMDGLKQLFADVMRQVLSEMNVDVTSSSGNSQSPNASRLLQGLEVFQVTDPSKQKPQVTALDIPELEPTIVDLVKETLSNPASWPGGLPPSPALSFGPSTPLINADELEKRLVEASDTRSQSDCTEIENSPSPGSCECLPAVDKAEMDAEDDERPSAAKVRGSVLGFKKVMEMWDKDTSKYKIVESIETDDTIDDLDQYPFVVREHINKNTKETTSYIDVKSEPLREIFRDVLRDVKAVSLMEDKPSIKEDILFHFQNELCDYAEMLRGHGGSDTTQLDHLTLLINRLNDTYSAISERLTSLLRYGEITYDLLWALFRPGCPVYTKCFGTGKPRCVIFDAGEEVTDGGVTFYKLECRYLDFDGNTFGEAEICPGIVKFRGSKRISTLGAFPLHYHPNHERVRKQLVKIGDKFCDLTGTHLCQCNGVGFIMQKGEIVQMNINSQVAVDAAFFCEMRPNYSRPCLQDTWTKTPGIATISISTWYDTKENEKPKSKDRGKLADDDLLICCPTVRCFSFKDKCFLECAVSDLTDAKWYPESFNTLKIPEDTKQTLLSLATTRLGLVPTVPFDDAIKGKGRGLNVLLHGPPGVGKTFTVEATSEKFGLPLYSISAGELIVQHGEPHHLDQSLDEIFKIAKHFNAVLLLDEADAFMERRTSYHDSHNQLLTVFLRKLEYFEGILFLTTNRVAEFDDAILSRIHLKIKYEKLTKEARREIWRCFLSKAYTHQGPSIISDCDLERLESIVLNGRDIKNLTSIAHALATFDRAQMTYKHLEKAAKTNNKFVDEFDHSGRIEGLYT